MTPAKANKKYDAIRGALLLKGTNLSRWAEANGYAPTTVYLAARQLRRGIISVEILTKLNQYVRS